MLIETDIILAHIKDKDWLKPYAQKILFKAVKGELKLYISREVIHEIYYIARKYDLNLSYLLNKIVALTSMENIVWLPTTLEIDLIALTLMIEYNIKSIFDAYYAATTLTLDPDNTIISTDTVYDRVPGIKRIDPRDIT